MTRLRHVGVAPAQTAPAPMPQDAATLTAALREVWDGHLYLDFDWYGWRERARTALGIPVSAATGLESLFTADKPLPQPASMWHEDIGEVLWWRFPVTEAPYVGSPLADDWIEDHYTHWTPIPIPMEPVTP